MKAASFFTGAGGFDLGFEQAGIEIVFQCEKDKFANQLLNDKYPHTPKADDITTLQPSQVSSADIYFGGFPCQDASEAGNRKGLTGERTGLFFDFVRIIKANKPQWIVLENVVGLLYSSRRNDFKLIIEALAQCGYYLSWRVLDAQYFGVPQRRRRVFIVGYLGEWKPPFQVLFEPEIKAKNDEQSSKIRTDVSNEIGDRPIAVETTFLTNSGRTRKLHYSELASTLCASDKNFAFLEGEKLRYPTPVECERLMGFEDNWTSDFSDTQRYRLTGNAVAVPVAKFLGQRILKANSVLVSEITGRKKLLRVN